MTVSTGAQAAHSERILIVDDEQAALRVLERILEHEGYTMVRATPDPRQAIPVFDEFRPDIVLLDLRMPHVSGFEVLKGVRARIAADEYLPILVLTATDDGDARSRALSGGAQDFLAKPFDRTEVLLRIRNLLQTRALHEEVRRQNATLEERVREKTDELRSAYAEVLERLADAVEYRDFETGQHNQRVGEISALIAEEIGFDSEGVELIRRAAPLHDLGKIGVADSVLHKPGALTPEEFSAMQTHTAVGARVLSGSPSELVRMAGRIAAAHHECWDGSGYPGGLAGDAIPIEARIVAVADVYDALSHERPYREAWPEDEVLAHLQERSGTQFDPAVLDAFLRVTRVTAG